MKTFKAFNPDLTCRDFQYKIGESYSLDGVIDPCNYGFHACENPLDVLDYYDLTESRFCEVKQSGDIEKNGDKTVSSEITIGVELGLPGFIKASVQYVKEICNRDENSASGDYSQLAASGYRSKLAASGDDSKLAASGDYSKLAASGYRSKLAASGDYSQLAASGDDSKLAASGDYSQLAASGDYSKLAASGDYSQLAASGYRSKLAASGDYSKLAASGYRSKLAASGDYSVIVSSGINSKLKGVNGTLICLTHFDGGKPVKFTTGKIGENGLKENVFYMLDDNGKFIECGE